MTEVVPNFAQWAQQVQSATEEALAHVMPESQIAPERLHQAMRYSVLGGGKRVRALLVHAAGELCGAETAKIIGVASAVELIHAYSLVHDDMPCMDDDDLRRGKPSCHKEFDEATALLVGDALQSLAFGLLSTPGLHDDPQQQLQMVHLLAQASGSRGMAGGQAIDLASVGLALTQEQLEFMHLHKTGALIRAAILLGAWCSNRRDAAALSALDHYAKHIGLAFQVVDDILDSEADTATLGKTSGKDKDANKPTYVTILGVTRARKLAAELHENAIAPLAGLDKAGLNNSLRLIQIADYIMQRSY
ncbi:MAG TPA: farnesyl diphosphate synthase [Methylophilaceae bacterium]|jgi:farnesyl diphosphate synthase